MRPQILLDKIHPKDAGQKHRLAPSFHQSKHRIQNGRHEKTAAKDVRGLVGLYLKEREDAQKEVRSKLRESRRSHR